MNQYTLWQYRSGHWHRMGVVVAESAGGNYSPSAIPQCITSGNNSHPSISGNILAGYTP